MFSSGASDLESVLRDVEPILRGNSDFQFTYPSFKEILAAKQFADEINSGRLSVKGAYYFWSCKIGSFKLNEKVRKSNVFSLIWPYNKSVLNHVACMLSENKLKRLVEIISGDVVRCKNGSDLNSRIIFDNIVETSELCSRYVSLLSPRTPTGRTKEFLDMMLSFIVVREDKPESLRFELGIQKVADALALTRSTYVAEKLVAYLNFCEKTISAGESPNYAADEGNDFGYSTFNICDMVEKEHEQETQDKIIYCQIMAIDCLRKLAESGTKIPSFLPDVDYESNENDMWFVGKFGDLHCLDAIVNWMCDAEFTEKKDKGSFQVYDGYFKAIFDIVSRYDFKPELIKKFNDKISKIGDKEFLEIYHAGLSNFAAEMVKGHNVNLYGHLEKNKMQFLDSEVYKPK